MERASLRSDGVYVVEVTWMRPNGSWRRLRADAFAFIGEVAEATTHVRQLVADGAVEYWIATGMVSGDAPFTGHGHLLQLRVVGPQIPQFIAGTQPPSAVRLPASPELTPP